MLVLCGCGKNYKFTLSFRINTYFISLYFTFHLWRKSICIASLGSSPRNPVDKDIETTSPVFLLVQGMQLWAKSLTWTCKLSQSNSPWFIPSIASLPQWQLLAQWVTIKIFWDLVYIPVAVFGIFPSWSMHPRCIFRLGLNALPSFAHKSLHSHLLYWVQMLFVQYCDTALWCSHVVLCESKARVTPLLVSRRIYSYLHFCVWLWNWAATNVLPICGLLRAHTSGSSNVRQAEQNT